MFQDITAQINDFSLFSYLVTVSGVTSIAGILSWRWWKHKSAYKPLELLPSPPKHWLLGNLPQVLLAVKQKKLFRQVFDWSQQLGPIYVLWYGSSPGVILSQPKVIEDTIVKLSTNLKVTIVIAPNLS